MVYFKVKVWLIFKKRLRKTLIVILILNKGFCGRKRGFKISVVLFWSRPKLLSRRPFEIKFVHF